VRWKMMWKWIDVDYLQ